MKLPPSALILIAYTFFGVGMLTGQALASNPTVWIAIMIIAAINCVIICIPLHSPRKKRLPRRNVRIVR